ncbi:MAG: PEP-CTERM sorting domain-containing protein [Halofilum sp. (in: g-proteobacteria)]|nr:PEP-CTERM sorting domain-containing protein [Halofilum sp. (in: g-proteobacteria)]
MALLGGLVMAPAHATLSMDVTDNDGVVQNFVETSPGVINVSEKFGLFLLTIQSTSSDVGSTSPAGLFSLSSNVESDGAGSISVSVTEDAYTIPAAGDRRFTTGSNPVTLDGNSSYTVETFIDGVSMGVGSLASVTDDYFDSGEFTVGTPFSITHTYTITTTSKAQNITFDYSTRAVPVPGVLGLLGLGLVGLAFSVRRRKS